MVVVRSDEEIDRVLNWCTDAMENGSHYPGESFEDGVQMMFEWLTRESADCPAE